METLLRNARADTIATQKTGGWSGALATPQQTSAYRAATPSSVAGSSFSIGSAAPVNRSTHRVKYLGPGMSPRRFKPTATTRTMSSLFDDAPGKKRKTATPDIEIEQDDAASSTLSTSQSTPNLAAARKAAEFNQRAALSVAHGSHRRPSPLTQSVVASPDGPPTPSDIARKRMNDIIQDVLDNEITPNEEKPKQVFNPYEDVALPSGKHFTPYASLRKSSSSNNVSLRRSMAASRGAAARLDSERMKASTSGRPLSTLEMINRGRPSASSSASTPAPPAKKQKKPDSEPIVIDDDEDETPAPTPKPTAVSSAASSTPSRKTPAAVTLEEPEPVKAFASPSLSMSTIDSASPAPKPVSTPSFPSTADSIVAASKPTPAPAFSTQPLGLGPPPPQAPAATPSKAAPAPSKVGTEDAIYLSAKDSALSVDKHALPFFTFTLSPLGSQPSDSAKAAAMRVPIDKLEKFTFAVQNSALPASYFSPPTAESSTVPPAPSVPSSSTFTIPKKDAPSGQWTCGLCQLQNPASATEKCTICEAPKPGAKAAAPAPAPTMPPAAPATGGFNFAGSGFKPPASASGAWTCDTCMLQNTASDTEKCSVCEAPKPGAAPKAAAPPAVPSLPAAPTGGFNFAGAGIKPPAKSSGEWDCDTCMLKNPASATEKCTVCEAPRPGAAASAAPSAPSAPSAPPSAPTGGFTFGGKPVSTSGTSAPAAPTTAPAFGGFKPPAAGGFSFGGQSVGGSSSSTTPAASSTSSPFGGFGGFGVKPPSGGFSFGQKTEDKPAMLSKPTGAAGEWTCSMCGLKNPASATEKCTVCDEPKPKP